MKYIWLSIAGVIIATFYVVVFEEDAQVISRTAQQDTTEYSESLSVQEGPYPVLFVIDGDTVAVEIENKEVRVRLIGIDAPESNGPYTSSECFSDQATQALRNFIGDRSVHIELDTSQGEYDVYDRLLGYVYVKDNLFVNRELLRGGYVREYTHKGVLYRHRDQFKEDEIYARENNLGIWAVCEEA